MSSLLSIDPGLKVLGWAYWEGRELVCCGLSTTAFSDVVSQAAAHRVNLQGYEHAERKVCEQMVWRGTNAKSSPDDILKINIIAGHVGDEWVTPQKWKGGSIPKAIHHPRILAQLGEYELSLLDNYKCRKDLKHNIVDAIGIGLYALGRLRSKT